MTKKTVNADSLVKARPEIFSTSVGDEVVLFDAKNGKYFGAGVVVQHIWDSISEPKTAGAVCDELMEKFDVDRATCEAQVFAFLEEMSERGLLENE